MFKTLRNFFSLYLAISFICLQPSLLGGNISHIVHCKEPGIDNDRFYFILPRPDDLDHAHLTGALSLVTNEHGIEVLQGYYDIYIPDLNTEPHMRSLVNGNGFMGINVTYTLVCAPCFDGTTGEFLYNTYMLQICKDYTRNECNHVYEDGTGQCGNYW